MNEKSDNNSKSVSLGGLITFIVILGLFAFIGWKLFKPTQTAFRQNQVRAGRMAPDFQFPDLKGKLVALSDFRGKVVLLNIWATWCRPCVEEMPALERLYQKLKGKPFEIVAVSVDSEGLDNVQPFVKKLGLSFPILMNTNGSIRQTYGTTGVPESFIIDQEGKIVRKIIGPLDWDQDKFVDSILDLISPQK